MVEKTAVVVVDRHSGGGTVVIAHYAAGNGSVSLPGKDFEAIVVIILTAAVRGNCQDFALSPVPGKRERKWKPTRYM